MTVQDSNFAFKHRSLVLHFRCLLGSLGHHFGSFGGPFWDPKSFMLAPCEALGTLKKPVPKKSSKKVVAYPMAGVHLGTILASFFYVFLVNLLVRFLDHFLNNLRIILGGKMKLISIQH